MTQPGDQGAAIDSGSSVTDRGLSRSRRGAGFALAAAALPLLTVAMLAVRDSLALGSILLLYLLVVVVVAVVGGLLPAALAAVAAFLLANVFFTPPYSTFVVESRDSAVALVVFVVVGVLVALTVDVSARRRVSAAQNEARATLMAERAQRLQDRAERLAEVDRVRSSLLAAVGHDLRTPLAGIKAAASSLRQEDVAWSAQDRRELLETIESGADRLDDLIGNLLAMSRLRAGVLSVDAQAVALDEVVGRALLDRPSDVAADVAVRVDVPETLPAVRADPGLLERVVANLVANACRYSPPGATVDVRGELVPAAAAAPTSAPTSAPASTSTASPSEEGDGIGPRFVRLLVVDHGPGVPESSWGEIFQPFQRLDDRTSGGVGLGLAIVQGFTEAMGATVSPERTPGGGQTMVVVLPVAGPR